MFRGAPGEWRGLQPGVIGIGVFDGVHLGHQAIVGEVTALASEQRVTPTALTFDPHPLAVVDPSRAPRPLTSIDRRATLLGAHGIEQVVVLPFSERVQAMSAAEFFSEIVNEALQARGVVVGADFRFGARRSGDADALRRLCGEAGLTFAAVDLIGSELPVSSSSVRALLEYGDVAAAAQELGRHHDVDGIVVPGAGRGGAIGVPTANVDVLGGVLLPKEGVYAVLAGVDGAWHPAVANIGTRPTFESTRLPVLEVHLLDGDHELRGSRLRVAFVERLRDERPFPSADALVAQIHADIAAARQVLATPTP